MDRRIWIALLCFIAFYLTASLALGAVTRPFCDEGWFGSPGLNLIRHGTFETSVIEPAGSFLKGIQYRTYYEMPGWFLGLSLWFRIFGFGLRIMRAFSSFWGAVGIASCFWITFKLTVRAPLALLAAGILAFDAIFIIGGATARMDIMAAALDFAGIAVYLALRERRLGLALLLSNTLICISALSHPNGAIAFFALVFLGLYLDRKRIRFLHVALTGLPYVVGLAAWGAYIHQAPADFAAQFSGNAMPEVRGMVFHDPLTALKREMELRYFKGFGLTASGIKRVRGITLLAYLAGLLGAAWTSRLRRQQGVWPAVVMTLIMVSGLFAIDGIKRTFYLVYVVPMFAIVLAMWIYDLWRERRLPRGVTAGAVAGLFALQAAGIGWLVAKDPFRSDYMPTIDYLKAHKSADTVVMGPSELGYELGYDNKLVDDFRLGYDSGKRPGFIVVDANYRGVFDFWKATEPAVYDHVRQMLDSDYRPVFTNADYVVYAPKQ